MRSMSKPFCQPDVGVIVAAVHITTVHHHGMQQVVPRSGRELGQVQSARELEAAVQLHLRSKSIFSKGPPKTPRVEGKLHELHDNQKSI